MATSVLISRHDKIGDFVVALPIFQCLKAFRSDLKLVALVAKVNVSLARELDYIDEVIEYDPTDMPATLRAIKKANCSVSISAYIDNQLGFLLWKAGIPKRIAPATKIAQIWFNHRVKQRRSRVEKTEFQYNLDLLKAMDDRIDNPQISFPLFRFDPQCCDDAVRAFCDENDLDIDLPIIGLHPGSGGSTDGNLTLEHYVGLAKALILRGGCQVVFTFGPDDRELASEVERRLGEQVVIYQSQGSIYDFALLLSGFSVFVSTSTGTMHLAAGMNIRTLSFFGEVKVASPARWASVNQSELQNNFSLSEDYPQKKYDDIEARLLELVAAL